MIVVSVLVMVVVVLLLLVVVMKHYLPSAGYVQSLLKALILD